MHQCTNAPTSHARLQLGHVHCCAAYRRGTPAYLYALQPGGSWTRLSLCPRKLPEPAMALPESKPTVRAALPNHAPAKCLPHSVFAPWPDFLRCSKPTEGGNRTPSHSRYAVVLQSQLCGCVRQRMLSATLFCCRSHVHRNASRVYPYRGRSRSRQSTRRRHSRSREHSRRRHGRRSRCASRNGSPRHHSGI